MISNDCEYLVDDTCCVVGDWCDEPVKVEPKTCEFCGRCTRPGPRQRNSVTASASIRFLRANNQDRLKMMMPTFAHFLSNCKNKNGRGQQAVPAGTQNLRLICNLSPGDITTLTAAVYSLHRAYPGAYRTAVETSCMAIWEHNPALVQEFPEGEKVVDVRMEYPAVHECNERSTPFLGGYTEFLGSVLGIPIPLMTNRPLLFLSEEEQSWMPQVAQLTGGRPCPYWVVCAGVKKDFPAKQWPVEYYQELINRTRRFVEWVQIGEEGHDHPDLEGVIDLRGKTNSRELIRLVYHSSGGLGPVTFLQHLCAAWRKPYMCLLGGREPVTWVTYPKQHTFHTIGSMDCCADAACWKSRVVKLGDGDKKDDHLCTYPVLSGRRPVARCMQLITPAEVAAVMERYL